MVRAVTAARCVTLSAVATFAALFAGVVAAPPVAAATPPPIYLVLGASASVGVQPTAARPHGQPTDAGYGDDLVAFEHSRWPGLAVVHLGCPGATTGTMLDGGWRCAYPQGSQLGAAVAFLRAHPSTVLVTVDLGFNDLLRCMRHEVVDAACTDHALATVHDRMLQILSALRAAAPPGADIVGMDHYDPYLGDYVMGPAGQAFANASLSVMQRLDDVLRSTFRSAGAPMAGVASAFALSDRQPVTLPGLGTVPSDVGRTCALTWMCASAPLGHNIHPNDEGYRKIAAAIAEAVAGSVGEAAATS